MKPNRLLLFIVITTLLASCRPAEEVDLVVHNGTIYMVDENFAKAEAMAIKDGKIVAIGAQRAILNKYAGKETLDLGTRSVIPGIIDAHCHFVGYAKHLEAVDLTSTKSWEEVLEKAKAFHVAHPDVWITGRGWDHTKWEDAEFPHKYALDSLFPTTPVYLKRVDGHAAIANQAALDLAGISGNTAAEGGEIVVNASGLTGVLIDKPCELVEAVIPKPDYTYLKPAFQKAQENCFAYGITTVVDCGLEKYEVEAIDQAHKDGVLDMKVYAMLTDNEENFKHYLNAGHYLTERLKVRAFKFYADGALGSRGACLCSEYRDQPRHFGKMQDSLPYYQHMAEVMKEKGFQMCTHCIGDSANRYILGVYGKVLGGTNDLRWRIEHAQVVHPDDFEKFAEYSVIPSVQPTHATSDMRWAEKRLGPERVRFAYALNDLKSQLQWIPLGTDFPVEDINPFATFYAAVWRKNMKGEPADGFQTENALNKNDALRGMTVWAAMSCFEETEKGSLQIGKAADFVVLDRDIMTVPEELIPETKALYTYINGKQVYNGRKR